MTHSTQYITDDLEIAMVPETFQRATSKRRPVPASIPSASGLDNASYRSLITSRQSRSTVQFTPQSAPSVPLKTQTRRCVTCGQVSVSVAKSDYIHCPRCMHFKWRHDVAHHTIISAEKARELIAELIAEPVTEPVVMEPTPEPTPVVAEIVPATVIYDAIPVEICNIDDSQVSRDRPVLMGSASKILREYATRGRGNDDLTLASWGLTFSEFIREFRMRLPRKYNVKDYGKSWKLGRADLTRDLTIDNIALFPVHGRRIQLHR